MSDKYDWADDPSLSGEQILSRFRKLPLVGLDLGYACQHCEQPFDPVRTRWLCPHCHAKNTCCE